MSYDLAVFDPAVAPRDRAEFLAWYARVTEWTERRAYDDPKGTSAALRAWFRDMIATFPAMNGPYAKPASDDAMVTDYSIAKAMIYAAFAWSKAKQARAFVVELAAKHRLGFYDVSATDGAIVFPKRVAPAPSRARSRRARTTTRRSRPAAAPRRRR